jgi:hypothetical protein
MSESLLVISTIGKLERVHIPITVYNINLRKYDYGKMFTVDSIIMTEDEIIYIIKGRKYKHGFFEIYLNPPVL